MKKLSMMLAVAALVATGCDPYDDAPGGAAEIISVTAAGRLVFAVTHDGPVDGFYVLDDGAPEDTNESGFIDEAEFVAAEDLGVPAGAGGNNVIVVTTNRLLDGASIQSAPQVPTDATSIGDCRPANNWLTITKNGAPEALTYADTAGGSPYQWYTCYYPGAATSAYGASIEIFRGRVDTAPGLTTATRPLTIARLEAGMTYELTGSVNDDSGNPLAINVRVVTGAAP
jgi:hypothetical protein